MRTRILVGVVAWLLGAATATAGSLLAVSLLGQGITGTSGLLLSQQAVNRALASEPAEQPGTASASPAASPGETLTPAASATGTPTTSASTPGGEATSTAAGTGPTATVLTSRGGNVVASCLSGGAYLDSWSPLIGYEVGVVHRGPASVARVTFGSNAGAVTMLVSCSDGVPSATTYSSSPGHDE